MGLNIQALDAKGNIVNNIRICAYSAFGRWRADVASSVGINLKEMDGYGGHIKWDGKPCALVLNHSDCDGGYTSDELPQLLDELLSITASNTRVDFITICREALAVNGSLEYC